jgi:NADH:ubiquinone oxidoreductase subunit E
MQTAEERQKVLGIIEKHNDGPSSLIQVLNFIQEEHGYLPMEVQQLVAKEMNIPFSQVVEVSSFYSRFTTEKLGEFAISVCMGTACYVKNAQSILDEFKTQIGVEENVTTPDGKFTVIPVRCIGACGLAPVLTVNKDVYGKINTREQVTEILALYK